jgi:hypothetical protein
MRLGYDLEKTESRVCEIFGIEKGAIFSRSRVKVKADAIADSLRVIARCIGHLRQSKQLSRDAMRSF